MYIIIERTYIFRVLQRIISFVGGGRPSLPILGHILLQVRDNVLFVIGSDIDMEIIGSIPIHNVYKVGQITAPARKFFDICRTISEQSKITLKYEDNKLFIYSENSCFVLSTFSSLNFPSISSWENEVEFSISSSVLRDLIELTQFSMGKQDVRYYLNGMLFEFDENKFCSVATDGHRLAFCSVLVFYKSKKIKSSCSIIVPRKYIINILRILSINEDNIKLKIGKKNISMEVGKYILTSKLINGVFPNYYSVFSQKPPILIEISSEILLKAIKRSLILCNEKFHVVKFLLSINQLKVISTNSEHEISEQTIDVIYSGRDMEIGFNVYYIFDVLNVIRSKKVHFLLTDEHSSVQIIGSPIGISSYVVMPIRL